MLAVLALSAWRTWQETSRAPADIPLTTVPGQPAEENGLDDARLAKDLLQRFDLHNDVAALDQAAAHAASALSLSPKEPEALLVSGLVHDARSEYELARSYFERAQAIDPDSPQAVLSAANTYLAQGELGTALQWLQRAQALAPRNYDFSGGLVLLNDCLEDHLAARQWSEWLDQRITNEPMALALQARHHYLGGNFEAALQTSNIALNLDLPRNGHADAIFMRIKRDEALGHGTPEAGIELFSRRYPGLFQPDPEITPGNIMQAIDLAQLHRLAGQDREARKLTRSAVEAYDRPWFTSGSARAWLAPARAEALAIEGDRKGALAELQRIVDQGWRIHWRWETEMNPNFQSVRNAPEFQALIAGIEADMSRQREALLAENEQPGCPGCGTGAQ